MCACFIFIRWAGIRHSAAFQSISVHSIALSSPGRTNSSGDSLRAALVAALPS